MTALKAKEHDVQRSIVDALVMAGFRVKSTTAYRQKASSGVSKGIADLLVFHKSFPSFHCLCLEVKAAEKYRYSCPEQEEAHLRGEFFIVWSPLMALRLATKALEGTDPRRDLPSHHEAVGRAKRVLASFEVREVNSP